MTGRMSGTGGAHAPHCIADIVGDKQCPGLFHGHAHGTELPEGQSGLLYSIGFVVSTGLLHGAGIGIGELSRLSWGGNVLRGAGAVIALAGLWFTWSAVAG